MGSWALSEVLKCLDPMEALHCQQLNSHVYLDDISKFLPRFAISNYPEDAPRNTFWYTATSKWLYTCRVVENRDVLEPRARISIEY